MRQKGKEAFEEYYRSVCHSDEEFADLMTALKTKPLPILRFSKKNEERLEKLWREARLTFERLDWYPLAVKWPKEMAMGEKLPGYEEGLIYPMSEASLLPVVAMEIKADDVVLDACAAPGGKAVMIAESLNDPDQLIANDLSPARAARMRRVFETHGVAGIRTMVGPAEKLARRLGRLTVDQSRDMPQVQHDPGILGQGIFDKILVDAVCSSEAHVYRSPEHLKKWSHKRVEKLARRQVKLVEALMPLLKPGGRLVYSTCAVTPEENEGVVEKISKTPLRQPSFALMSFGRGNGFAGQGFELELESVADVVDKGPGDIGRAWRDISFDRSKVRRVWPVAGQLEPMFVAVWRKPN